MSKAKPETASPAGPGEATAADQPAAEAAPAKSNENAPQAVFHADAFAGVPGNYVIDPTTGERSPA